MRPERSPLRSTTSFSTYCCVCCTDATLGSAWYHTKSIIWKTWNTLHHITTHYIISQHIISQHIISQHITLQQTNWITSDHITSHRVPLHITSIILYLITFNTSHPILSHITPSHLITLCYITFHNIPFYPIISHHQAPPQRLRRKKRAQECRRRNPSRPQRVLPSPLSLPRQLHRHRRQVPKGFGATTICWTVNQWHVKIRQDESEWGTGSEGEGEGVTGQREMRRRKG